MKKAALLFCAVLAVTAACLNAQSAKPWTGTWQLAPEESTYGAGQAPQSATVTLPKDGSLKYEEVNAAGLAWSASIPAPGNGAVTFSGAGAETALLTCERKEVDARTVEYAFKQENGNSLTVTMAVSPDGKTLTATSRSVNRRGKVSETVAVFKKGNGSQ